MKEQHPIDELFARGLRDAKAAPSAAVWEGIVQERGWAHLTLLQLRRRWGWLALVFLLGGGATYLGINSGNGKELAESQLPEQRTHPALMILDVSQTAPSNTVISASFGEVEMGSTRTSNVTTQDEQHSSVPNHGQQTEEVLAAQTARVAIGSSRSPDSPEDLAVSQSSRRNDVSTLAQPMRIPRPTRAEQGETEKAPSSSADASLTAELPLVPDEPAIRSENRDRNDASDMELVRPSMLQIRPSILERELLAADLRYGNQPQFRAPHRAWWVAATAGQFRETRTWHGGDTELVIALQGTETPHHTLNFGVLTGISYHGGFGLATGLEYSAARYDFQHLDQFSSVRDSLITHVITFNSQVVESYVDTLTTYTEVRRTVAAVNHYTSIRVPLEGSWHKAWRRWHFGVRGGMALEFNTMRSGVTLMNEQGGTRSVDVSSTEKRTAVLLSGGLAADVGYAINERLAIWASPGYATGLFSLSPSDGTPYAMPERMGIRFRLAYTLRPSR